VVAKAILAGPGTWTEKQEKFVDAGLSLRSLSKEAAENEPVRKYLRGMWDDLTRKSPETGAPVNSGAPSRVAKSPIPLVIEKGVASPRKSGPPNLGEMQLAREIDDLIRDMRKAAALAESETLDHHDRELDEIRSRMAKRIDNLLPRVARSATGKWLSMPTDVPRRDHALELLIAVRKHLPDGLRT